MELSAAIEALRLLKEPCSVTLYTDSKYLVDGITNYIHRWEQNGWTTRGPEGCVHTNGKVSFISPNDYSRAGRKRVTGTVSVEEEKVIVREVL